MEISSAIKPNQGAVAKKATIGHLEPVIPVQRFNKLYNKCIKNSLEISIYTMQSLQQLVMSSEKPKNPDIYTYTVYIGITLVFIHELMVGVRQLDSVAQLVRAIRALQRYRRAAVFGGPIVAFFATAPWLGLIPLEISIYKSLQQIYR
jgi:hypothetical protein